MSGEKQLTLHEMLIDMAGALSNPKAPDAKRVCKALMTVVVFDDNSIALYGTGISIEAFHESLLPQLLVQYRQHETTETVVGVRGNNVH